ncbi:MAG: hypothetical protein HQM08_11630 [Candidatus Riflebacteria bacterium]|nr:hypothetical protein [Candidatus Riflebacteria bacterium]
MTLQRIFSKNCQSLRFFPLFLMFLFFPLFLNAKEALKVVARLSNPILSETLIGAMAYLEDTQIRPRSGKNDLFTDSSEEGDGCRSKIYLNIFHREILELPVIGIHMKNRTGEWASQVNFLPKKTGSDGRTLISVQDTNMFITAFVGFPLFLFQETKDSIGSGFIQRMLSLCYKNIEECKRGDAFNFWPSMEGAMSHFQRTGPMNIPVFLIKKLAEAFVNPKFDGFFKKLCKGMKIPPKDWIYACLSPKNPTGADAFFNIPDDADDTSTAVAFQKLMSERFPRSGFNVDYEALKLIQGYRDLNRTREDGRDTWKGQNSGAFLTWMRDENRPTFENPEIGIIPLGVNNVDLVVNANVAFSLALNNMKILPGYKEAIDLLGNGIEKHTWPQAGLYYPQNMIFPYTVSRAFRDGGATELRESMKKLLIQVLDEQDSVSKTQPKLNGVFPGGEDESYHLSTALGLVTLLNIGQGIAEECNCLPRYSKAVDGAVNFLLNEAKCQKLEYQTTKEIFGDKIQARKWETGLFFAASFWDLGHWRSQAFTESVVIESLAKYMMGYELPEKANSHSRLVLVPDQKSNCGITLQMVNSEK